MEAAGIGMSGVTDCYQPMERQLKLTRRCLEVLAEFRNPVGIITKNHLVTRDMDVLRELARHQAVHVNMSINSLDRDLARKLEPRTASPRRGWRRCEILAEAGVPVGVLVAPVIPALNDHEIPAVLAAAKAAGAGWAGTEVLRLPLAVAPMFEDWLDADCAGEEGQDSGPHPRDARGQAQRLSLRQPHARRGDLRGPDRADVRGGAPEGGTTRRWTEIVCGCVQAARR